MSITGLYFGYPCLCPSKEQVEMHSFLPREGITHERASEAFPHGHLFLLRALPDNLMCQAGQEENYSTVVASGWQRICLFCSRDPCFRETHPKALAWETPSPIGMVQPRGVPPLAPTSDFIKEEECVPPNLCASASAFRMVNRKLAGALRQLDLCL